MRPKKWFVNSIVLWPLILLCKPINLEVTLNTFIAFFIVCLLSSANYIINDYVNHENDFSHPIKFKRSLVLEKVNMFVLIILVFLIFFVSIIISLTMNLYFGLFCLLFVIWQIMYTFIFRELFIIDVLVIGGGYILRVAIGAFFYKVPIDFSFMFFVFFLCCFILFCKRKQELLLNDDKIKYRRTLLKYKSGLLDKLIFFSALLCIISYVLLTNVFITYRLTFTLPFIVYGICRYVYLVYYENKGLFPEKELFSDKPLVVNYLLCVLVFFILRQFRV